MMTAVPIDDRVTALCTTLRAVAGMLVDAQDDLHRTTAHGGLLPRAWMPALDDLHLALTEFAALTDGLNKDFRGGIGTAVPGHQRPDGARAVDPLGVAAQLIAAAATFAAAAYQAAGREGAGG